MTLLALLKFWILGLTPWEAALGTSVRVPTLDGAVEMRVLPDSANGRMLRLKGRGLPYNPPGDLYVRFGEVLLALGAGILVYHGAGVPGMEG